MQKGLVAWFRPQQNVPVAHFDRGAWARLANAGEHGKPIASMASMAGEARPKHAESQKRTESPATHNTLKCKKDWWLGFARSKMCQWHILIAERGRASRTPVSTASP